MNIIENNYSMLSKVAVNLFNINTSFDSIQSLNMSMTLIKKTRSMTLDKVTIELEVVRNNNENVFELQVFKRVGFISVSRHIKNGIEVKRMPNLNFYESLNVRLNEVLTEFVNDYYGKEVAA